MAYQINPFTGKFDITPFSLDGAGKIPSDYLPSYVDDVVEYDDLASFPGTGETGKIYVAKDTGYTYRWTGSVYARIGSGGEVALNLGSEGSPSLYFTGDPNTGIYSPGADQLALSTNGTGRLFINAAGQISAGGSTLAASQSVFGIKQVANNTKYRGLTIENSADDSYIAIAFDGTSDTFSISPSYGALGAFKPISFWTSNTERLRITSAGLVGIGTSVPSERLHLIGSTASASSGTAYNVLRLVGNSTVPANTGGLTFGAYWNNVDVNGRTAYIQSSQGLDAGSTARALLLNPSGGNVGIGTTSPSYALDVVLGIGVREGQALQWHNGSGSNSAQIYGDANDNLIFRNTSSNTERARIDSAGRLLVGTSSDSGGALLQVNGNRIRVATAKTPSSASDTGTAGEICWDADYIYVCTATNTWKRTAISTWP